MSARACTGLHASWEWLHFGRAVMEEGDGRTVIDFLITCWATFQRLAHFLHLKRRCSQWPVSRFGKPGAPSPCSHSRESPFPSPFTHLAIIHYLFVMTILIHSPQTFHEQQESFSCLAAKHSSGRSSGKHQDPLMMLLQNLCSLQCLWICLFPSACIPTETSDLCFTAVKNIWEAVLFWLACSLSSCLNYLIWYDLITSTLPGNSEETPALEL